MDESVFQQPTHEQLRQFVDGDPLAIDGVLEIVLPQLYVWAARQYPTIPQHDRDSVIDDVLLETVQHHERYNPNKALFTTYVIALIEKRMITVRRKQFTAMTQAEPLETISENLPQTLYDNVEENIVHRLDQENFFQLARSHLSPLEADFLDLMLRGEIHNPSFIDSLQRFGISNPTQREVTNTKERIKYTLGALARSHGLRLEDLL